jgi:hypothetical protein
MMLNINKNNNSNNTSNSETLGRLYTFLDNTNSNKMVSNLTSYFNVDNNDNINRNCNNIYIYIYNNNSRDSVVGAATGSWLNDRVVRVRAPIGSRIFSSPRPPDRLWGPPSLSNGYRGLFSRG